MSGHNRTISCRMYVYVASVCINQRVYNMQSKCIANSSTTCVLCLCVALIMYLRLTRTMSHA